MGAFKAAVFSGAVLYAVGEKQDWQPVSGFALQKSFGAVGGNVSDSSGILHVHLFDRKRLSLGGYRSVYPGGSGDFWDSLQAEAAEAGDLPDCLELPDFTVIGCGLSGAVCLFYEAGRIKEIFSII